VSHSYGAAKTLQGSWKSNRILPLVFYWFADLKPLVVHPLIFKIAGFCKHVLFFLRSKASMVIFKGKFISIMTIAGESQIDTHRFLWGSRRSFLFFPQKIFRQMHQPSCLSILKEKVFSKSPLTLTTEHMLQNQSNSCKDNLQRD